MSATIGLEYYEVFISESDKAIFANLLGVPVSEVRGQHLYLVYTNKDGNEFVIEGGPASQPPGPATPFATVAGEALIRNPVGVGESGLQTRESRNYIEIDVQGDVEALWEIMKDHAEAIEDAGIIYKFYPGPNSNSVVGSVLNSIGIAVADVLAEPLKSRPQEVTGANETISSVARAANIINGDSDVISIDDTNGLDIVRGGDNNESIQWSGGSDVVDGGAGLDVLLLDTDRADATLSPGNADGVLKIVVNDDVVTATNIERISFSDVNLAYDMDGNAGKVAKLLGAVFGKEAVTNAEYMGIGLSLLDEGMSYQELGALALAEAGLNSNVDIVSTLWLNVVGAPISEGDRSTFVTLLETGMERGELAVLAADEQLNIANIGLVGLADTGIEYMPQG